MDLTCFIYLEYNQLTLWAMVNFINRNGGGTLKFMSHSHRTEYEFVLDAITVHNIQSDLIWRLTRDLKKIVNKNEYILIKQKFNIYFLKLRENIDHILNESSTYPVSRTTCSSCLWSTFYYGQFLVIRSKSSRLFVILHVRDH